MSDNLEAGVRFTPDIYAKIGYDSQNETGEMSVIGANGETIWESGEGGGSGDLSIVNVTFTTTKGNEGLYVPVCVSNPSPDIEGGLFPNISFTNIGTQTYQIALFKGLTVAIGQIDGSSSATIFTSVSGSATLIDQHHVMITGDCSITVDRIYS